MLKPVSIIVPAHNEESVIRRCLAAMLDNAREGELEVIVVCNGCTDRTAEEARKMGVRVIETAKPSKIHALNLGDGAATHFPRFYVDADVVLPIESIRRVAASLRAGQGVAAAPRLEVDVEKSNALVRSFYGVWLGLPYFRDAIGSGVYALGPEGRSRFDRFPEITADDAFVRLMIPPGQRKVLDDCSFRITAPADLNSLIKIKTRSRRGNQEVLRRYPSLKRNDAPANRRHLIGLAARPWQWPRLAVYLWVVAVTAIRCRMHRARAAQTWERDESSRSGRAGTGVAVPVSMASVA